MTIDKPTAAIALFTVMMSVACGRNANPTAPTADSGPKTTSTPAAANASLSVSLFTLVGWHAGEKFHYVPTLAVNETTGANAVSIQSLSFKWTDTGATASGIKFGTMPRVLAGGNVTLLAGTERWPVVELTTSTAATRVSVSVSFVDDAGHPGEATATVPVPAVPTEAPAELVLSSFTVEGWYDAPRFHYWPKLALTSTGGTFAIKEIVFELLDVGPAGRVPPSWQSFSVPGGGTLELSTGTYDDPWLEIDSSADAARVSVLIFFTDEAGRGGELTAVAPVLRR